MRDARTCRVAASWVLCLGLLLGTRHGACAARPGMESVPFTPAVVNLMGPKLEFTSAVPEWQDLMRRWARSSACEKLGLVEWLCERMTTAETLARLKDAPVVAPLIGSLRDLDTDVRAAAAQALGGLGDPAAIEPLELCFTDRDELVRKAAAAALEKLAHRRSTP